MTTSSGELATPGAPAAAPKSALGDGPTVFALSFLALFLELMLIRWVPATVKIVAYYANLMLISSFLGLGLGALAASRQTRLFRAFPLLLAALVGALVAGRQPALPTSGVEHRFFAAAPRLFDYGVLVAIFVLNAALFVPLGQAIGERFHRLPPLAAYGWDLGGSLAGTVSFGLFSFYGFSPLVGATIVGLLWLYVAESRARLQSGPVLALAVALMAFATDRQASWSPYHYVTVEDPSAPGEVLDVAAAPAASELRTMIDPPIFRVEVNRNFYQAHGTIDPGRYRTATGHQTASLFHAQYLLPYTFRPGPRRVLVVGAGGGMDVEGALLAGAAAVDAVEIDPAIVAIARRISASGVYDDPRVAVHVDDARAFLRRSREVYDAVVFGFLDSQALSSSMSNIRLDGFVYTVESLRAADRLVAADGVLALSFFVGHRPWLAAKLAAMMREAVGREPFAYLYQGNLIFCSPKRPLESPPRAIGPYQRGVVRELDLPVATDDWPYLYLLRRTVPTDYLFVITVLAVLAAVGLRLAGPRGAGLEEGHFFFLGVGFLLLETTSILDCSLYFGATWLVTTLIVAGVLAMVLVANAVATRIRFRPVLYAPLLLSLALVVLVPGERILALPAAGRVLWTTIVVPLPIFFAGLVFSTTFRHAARPAAAFGANLLGATLGGFCEYLGMAIGYRRLTLVVVAAYLASLLCRRRAGLAEP